jgi:hypothetical protein
MSSFSHRYAFIKHSEPLIYSCLTFIKFMMKFYRKLD